MISKYIWKGKNNHFDIIFSKRWILKQEKVATYQFIKNR